MKKQTGIWIDASKAVIVAFSNKQEYITEVKSKIENRIHHENEGDKGSFIGSRHINNEKKFEEIKKHEINNFLKNVIEQIEYDDEFYVFGPADMKLKLKNTIEKDKHLAPKLQTVETAERMTNNQVVAKVKKFYNLN